MSILRSLVLLCALSGCAGHEGGAWAAWPWPGATAGDARGSGFTDSSYNDFRFDWSLAGDPRIMPLQVFDDGERMWLQFSPDGAWPAVFAVASRGWRPVSYRADGPYMVLEGVYSHLELRGGSLQGSIKRAIPPGNAAYAVPAGTADASPMSSSPTRSPSTVDMRSGVGVQPSAGLQMETGLHPDAAPSHPSMASPTPMSAAAITAASFPGSAGASVTPSAPTTSLLGPPAPLFTVGPADGTIRQALERWAGSAGWTFTPEHWAVDVDIPLVGQASFQADFKSAVRQLLASTEMGERPLQPCFYSNKVVRVVPYAEPCDRRKGMGAMS